MLPGTFTNVRVLTLSLLMLSFGSHHAALRNERRVSSQGTHETRLPPHFLMILSLKGGVNQFSANIRFNKQAIEELYSCLCQRDTYSCTGNVTFNYGTSYSYNTENITRVRATTAATMSTMYKCEIPNFGLLSNNGGGYFTCTRAESEDECATSYWSIYIGQCDLKSANVIWEPSHQAIWKYYNYINKHNRDIISYVICGVNDSSSNPVNTLVTSHADLTTSPRRDEVTTHVWTTTTNPTEAQLKSENNEAAVVAGAIAAVAFTALFVVGVVWSCILYRKKKKDANSFDEQSKQNNRKPLPDIPTRNSRPAAFYTIPEPGVKPEDIPRWSNSRRKDDFETTSSIYDVIGSGIYDNDIGVNENSSVNNNNNNSDEKSRTNIHITNINAHNKSPFGSSTLSDKAFSLTVTNTDLNPGFSKPGNKDNNIHNSQNKLTVPKRDRHVKQRQPAPNEEHSLCSPDRHVKQRQPAPNEEHSLGSPDRHVKQRQPAPNEEQSLGSPDSTGQESSGFSFSRYFQENYNFLNRPAEIVRVANANNNLNDQSGVSKERQNNNGLIDPLNIDEYDSCGTPYYKVDKYGFPYNNSIESGTTMTNQNNFKGPFIVSGDSLEDSRVSIIDLGNCK